MCQIPLSEERKLGGAVIIGEEAHIAGRSTDGPRGDSPLTEEDRDRYSNLILLCPTDHSQIDSLPDEYPVELLLSIKAQHEAAVMASDAFDPQNQVAEENWARLVDQLDKILWQTWQSDVAPFFDPNFPWVDDDFIDRLQRASEWIYGRIWPDGNEKLKRALEAFGQLLSDWASKFNEHAESPDPAAKSAMTPRFYKIDNWDPDLYHRLFREYQYHVRLLEDLALEATRYGNYIASLIRAELDSSYRFDEGLLIIRANTSIFHYQLLKPEFRPSDFNEGEPYKDLETFERDRSRRDICVKEAER